MDEITLKKGQVIKVGGMPFELKNDTLVLGKMENLELVYDYLKE